MPCSGRVLTVAALRKDSWVLMAMVGRHRFSKFFNHLLDFDCFVNEDDFSHAQAVATSGHTGLGSEVTFMSKYSLFALVLNPQCTSGCYPAQCSKVDMATNNFLLRQKYGIQVLEKLFDTVCNFLILPLDAAR